ncbi:unnamed protein product [Knipowitschia caucasica]|uniref:Uncharacterized protein n=1 Tax=Knipowitschia caucasica TaxID=637954 RepID=A0AAV2MN56_KNICA
MEPTPRQLRAKRRREAAAGGLRVALLGLGLLCLLQAALNIGLRLYGLGCHERCPGDDPSATPGPEPTTAERDVTEAYQTSQCTSASFTTVDPWVSTTTTTTKPPPPPPPPPAVTSPI